MYTVKYYNDEEETDLRENTFMDRGKAEALVRLMQDQGLKAWIVEERDD